MLSVSYTTIIMCNKISNVPVQDACTDPTLGPSTWECIAKQSLTRIAWTRDFLMGIDRNSVFDSEPLSEGRWNAPCTFPGKAIPLRIQFWYSQEYRLAWCPMSRSLLTQASEPQLSICTMINETDMRFVGKSRMIYQGLRTNVICEVLGQWFPVKSVIGAGSSESI